MFENLVSGLVSGLIATLFVVVFRSFWNSVITPWFEERVYKDIKIEGKWFALYPDSMHGRQEVITLERRGHAITGLIVCTHGPDTGEQYFVSGSFRNMILPMTYESSDKTKSDRGAIALKSVKNGKRLIGKVAMYDDNQDLISTTTVVWFRSKEVLKEYFDAISKKQERLRELKAQAGKIEAELNIEENIANLPKS